MTKLDQPMHLHPNQPFSQRGTLCILTATLAACLLAPLASLQAKDASNLAPRLDIGRYEMPISTSSREAQRYFNQGMAMMYGFNHAEAIRSFKAAAQLDPQCAIAWWGVAYAYGPNINAPMNQQAAAQAWQALQKARELAPHAAPREQDYIRALSHRYQETWLEDRSALDLAYANAMRELVQKHPHDLDARVLFAEALMDTMPWDYWTKDKTAKPATKEILHALESVIQRNPRHPGAHHFYIHAVEAGPNPAQGLPSADSLGNLVPDSGHLTHMPSHIYLRVGQYHDASEVNERAVRVDEAYIAQCRAGGFYPGTYYPHNVHFLWFTYSMEGRADECIREARKVAKYAYDNVCGPAEVVEAPRFRHLPLLAMARFGRWEEILQEKVPAGGHLFDQAMWHYTRGLAYLGLDQPAQAHKELATMTALVESQAAQDVDTPYFPGTSLLAIARHTLQAKTLAAQGNEQGMREAFAAAQGYEKNVPYMEPPYWYYPVNLAIGAALLRLGHAQEAEQAFHKSLEEYPQSGWGYYGLQESLKAQGKTREARSVARKFKKAWKHADSPPDLRWY